MHASHPTDCNSELPPERVSSRSVSAHSDAENTQMLVSIAPRENRNASAVKSHELRIVDIAFSAPPVPEHARNHRLELALNAQL